VLDRIVAQVNNEIITEHDLLVNAFGELQQTEGVSAAEVARLRSVLNSLIDERLMAQAALKELKEVPEEVITNRVEQIVKERKSLFPSEQAFLDALDKRGWDFESYKAYLREQEMRTYAVHAALTRRVRITEDDVRAYGEQLQRSGESLVHYRLRQILVALPPKPSDEEVKKAENRMLKILEQVQQGTPFERVARERSDDKLARATGGDIGWVAEKQLQRPIWETVRSLEKDGVSRPVRTDKGIQLFQLIRKRNVGDLLFEKRLQEVSKTWTAELRRRAQIRILLPQLAKETNAKP